ncbi:MAG: imidazoleglycerol-phosphate dehydratase [Halanaerobium sp. 4-GBenrich]|jgi:imidazoleglycerol-phosphate dehydratase|uniref:Imidazoleglycerol-phosphate dehydratase n=1 Tax=Halanaerobium congolense TaxID=54121 RepID=A0A1M7PFL7_9FIRM|nr:MULTISPECIES: imidazoleglycerol-phosphate dehydratase HisB [Halanaerobium]KXS49452.1 MAG: imidazoleglycerol-phosphate dehydratase [Halanaerobium sp. T82-1]ODS49808.1 MAG: imidazoleglycerol-phosphate dehydratase [Halanaerobium sp. 4-GBenrich]OEG63752.1 MAG: imidazoleglycerol-phosphate dehydratase [Halanaerobium sp. MDAL1]PTX16125.1 imidazoleglycerol-phosphate dehydratase [Halanaerobium congolense]PUU95079.1 MAG: imidazoleglycerol-phosphate dehydratase [Halanaerobium sp.]
MSRDRVAVEQRKTKETEIIASVNLDGEGRSEIKTGIGFFDHMLEQIARHGNIDLELSVKGDIHIDTHHSIEDTGIALGTAFAKALGNKKGIARFSSALVPLDETLVRAVVDISGRPYLYTELPFTREIVGDFPSEMVVEFMRAFAFNAGITLHLEILHGENCHHQIEAVFKALARALKLAVKIESDKIPSTKGVL